MKSDRYGITGWTFAAAVIGLPFALDHFGASVTWVIFSSLFAVLMVAHMLWDLFLERAALWLLRWVLSR